MNNKEILIIGGTGSLGSTLLRKIKTWRHPKGIRIYSRDEYKQWKLATELTEEGLIDEVAFLVGDVRDKERLEMAMTNADIVINCAALKHVPSCEYNPFEAVKTNIIGSENVINCAIANGVEKVMHISTDKCVLPINLYGATKTVAEKLFIHGNVYTGGRKPFMSCCRYGNVIASRGSVVELFKQQAKNGKVFITDPLMTRFWITLDDVAEFIIDRIEEMNGEEIFIPKMPSMNIMDLKEAVAPDADVTVIGIRKGEKLHECLVSQYETIYLQDRGDYFTLDHKTRVPEKDWEYTSDKNDWQLTVQELKEVI